VKALPKDMPEDVMLDVTPLDMGQSIKIKELNFENLELLDSPNSVVVTIRATRAVAAATRGGK
jgi:large subunit ribosomal protein L25